MRLATNSYEPVIIGDTVFGVNLGFDFCAEHEWGFKWAARHLGRPATPTRDCLGVKARTTTKHDPEFAIELVESGDALWLCGRAAYEINYTPLSEAAKGKPSSRNFEALYRFSRSKPFVAGWSGAGGFCVVGRNDDAQRAIRAAHDALIGDHCFIVQGGDNPFGAGGLKLIDAALIPEGVDTDLRARDISALDLEDTVAASGIRERLRTAGCEYYALSPRWEDEAKGTFTFWLNPMQQDRNNYGWFSLADLEAWIAGEGPIPKLRRRA